MTTGRRLPLTLCSLAALAAAPSPARATPACVATGPGGLVLEAAGIFGPTVIRLDENSDGAGVIEARSTPTGLIVELRAGAVPTHSWTLSPGAPLAGVRAALVEAGYDLDQLATLGAEAPCTGWADPRVYGLLIALGA